MDTTSAGNYVPRYVLACEQCAWHLRLFRKSDPEKSWVVPFTCRSWRCRGSCQMWKGAQDFTRVKEGMSKHTDWTVLTLTFDPKGWRTPWSMWRGGLHLWDRLRKRFIREWGKLRYVQTWESHRSGKPHVNIAISNENFYTACVMDWRLIRRQWVKPHARASGFGRIAHVTTAYDRDGLAGYFVKLARELTGTVHKDQIPYSAPPHFRRLRASQGLLPPAYKNDDISGRLHFYPPEIADLI